ncbi:hypothetical protein Hanom_Chr10g00927301 [Helianthus anomalus]
MHHFMMRLNDVSPAILAMESPMPMVEYTKDMMAAMMERNDSLWKLGSWLKTSSIHATIKRKGLFNV